MSVILARELARQVNVAERLLPEFAQKTACRSRSRGRWVPHPTRRPDGLADRGLQMILLRALAVAVGIELLLVATAPSFAPELPPWMLTMRHGCEE